MRSKAPAGCLSAGVLAFALCASFVAGSADAQVHERDFGAYTVRSSIVGSLFIPPEQARQHGIARAEDLAILNVAVPDDRAKERATAPAAVSARVAGRRGVVTEVPMRPIVEHGGTSYLGSFAIVPGEEVEISIVARPGSGADPLAFTFRDTMPKAVGGAKGSW